MMMMTDSEVPFLSLRCYVWRRQQTQIYYPTMKSREESIDKFYLLLLHFCYHVISSDHVSMIEVLMMIIMVIIKVPWTLSCVCLELNKSKRETRNEKWHSCHLSSLWSNGEANGEANGREKTFFYLELYFFLDFLLLPFSFHLYRLTDRALSIQTTKKIEAFLSLSFMCHVFFLLVSHFLLLFLKWSQKRSGKEYKPLLLSCYRWLNLSSSLPWRRRRTSRTRSRRRRSRSRVSFPCLFPSSLGKETTCGQTLIQSKCVVIIGYINILTLFV